MTVEDYLQARGVEFEKRTHALTYTAQELANVEHVSGYMVAKPVIVKAGAGFAMCVLAAPKHVDLKLVAEALGEPEARLATEAEMVMLFSGCEVGAEPPVGALFGLRTIMDAQLEKDDFLVMQAGTHRGSLRIRRTDWERVCEPLVRPIAAS